MKKYIKCTFEPIVVEIDFVVDEDDPEEAEDFDLWDEVSGKKDKKAKGCEFFKFSDLGVICKSTGETWYGDE